jgi:hypothetical protein
VILAWLDNAFRVEGYKFFSWGCIWDIRENIRH